MAPVWLMRGRGGGTCRWICVASKQDMYHLQESHPPALTIPPFSSTATLHSNTRRHRSSRKKKDSMSTQSFHTRFLFSALSRWVLWIKTSSCHLLTPRRESSATSACVGWGRKTRLRLVLPWMSFCGNISSLLVWTPPRAPGFRVGT